MKECETLCAAAKVLECPVIQLVPFEGLDHLPYEEHPWEVEAYAYETILTDIYWR